MSDTIDPNIRYENFFVRFMELIAQGDESNPATVSYTLSYSSSLTILNPCYLLRLLLLKNKRAKASSIVVDSKNVTV